MSRALFAELGLSADAGERAVKRAYALRLRQCRPDDDPAGFQRLHEVYRDLLEIVRRRPAVGAGQGMAFGAGAPPAPAVGTGIELPAQDDPAATDDRDDGYDDDDYDPRDDCDPPGEAAPLPAGFNLGEFLAELEVRGRTESTAGLRRWLDAHPALYSLALKASITVPVLDRACDWQPPLPLPALEEIAAFFGADRLDRRDWWVLGKLQALCRREQLRADIARGILPGQWLHHSWIDRLVEDEITGRPQRLPLPRRGFLLLVPGFPTRVHQRIEDMDQRTEGAIDAFIPEGTRALYAALASRDRLGWARVALAWARLALAMVLLPLLLVLLGGSPSPRHWLQAGGGLAVVILAWQAGHTLLIRGARLIRNRENAAAWSRRTRTAVALAIALAAALSPWDFLQVTAYFLAYVAAVAASGEQRHIAAMVLGVLLLAMDWMLVSWGLDMPLLWRGFTGLALTPLVILGWDALLARRKGKPLDPVTGLGGSLWPLVALVAALVVIQFNLVMRL